ncbi:DinB family protein [Belliella kenyensis]|uniref:DinB family protein n=1 Tax=Belliella kenyensis TaxID=1472724 RepID=A0ABV8EHW7_9BACT|nr:DinB family protein [Belliella kenyensis]MCH7401167.1 DinB family protein [Belliella kenyensis]MDN3604164.1 DinB family protein [Belliella kenyensis]
MKDSNSVTSATKSTLLMTQQQLLEHWQGHRALTRRVIEAFPEDEFFSFSIGGMRPFAIMIKELIAIAAPGAKGLATDTWEQLDEEIDLGQSKSEILSFWDKATEDINYWWSQIPLERFQEDVLAFGMYQNKGYCNLLYFIDNEIHHRAQAYVYLRSLGIAPPAFWER